MNILSFPSDPSVKYLIDLYREMGIPHFQRGLVWNDENTSLLLESLYFNTPCGTIILWAPEDPKKEGIPLSKPRDMKYLIIDGQQRIRSLWNVFKGDVDESINYPLDDGDSSGDMGDGDLGEDENGIWCLNLGRVREFEKDFTGGKRFRLFRRAKDPRKTDKDVRGAPLIDREALLPLRWFLEHTDEEITASLEKGGDAALKKAAIAVLRQDAVKKKLRTILTRPMFHVSTLDAAYRLEDVVGFYNRINSAGKRVESEEKAFANLVSAYPEVNKKLEEFFIAVHGGDASTHSQKLSAELSRDNLLCRQKENRFGFKLFMRTLVQVLAYHSSRTIGTSTFSFESMNADTMHDKRTRAHLPDILNTTVRILVYLAGVLREELYCDDFRMLPETSSFWPIVQLIIRFPGLMTHGKGITASFALRLLLANKQKKELLKLVNGINESQTVEGALELFEKDSDLAKTKLEKTISKGIENANSLTNRYTLILYWLLRNRAAKDFRYNINTSPEKADELRKQYGGTEARLCAAVEAEKQHIVPYKQLKKVFNLEGKARPGQHEIHNIGNLTYISHGENSFKMGVGSDPLKLDSEPQDNLQAHLLMDRRGDLLKAYNNACRNAELDNPKDLKRARHYFGKFYKKRRAIITQEFLSWEHAVRIAGRLPSSSDIRPAERLINPQDPDFIRQLGYPSNVESILITLRNIKGMVKSRKQGAAVSYGFRRKLAKRRKVQVVRVDLYPSPKEIEIKLSAVDLQEWFRAAAPNIPLGKDRKFKLDVNKPDAAKVVGMIFEKLQKIDQGDE